MDFEDLIVKVAAILDRLSIPYAITGGYAVSVWGRLRATFDIDVIVELSPVKGSELTQALKAISKTGYIDELVVKDAVERMGEFNFIHAESGIKVDFWVLAEDEYSEEKLARRIPKKIRGQKVYFVSPEDLILSKLLWQKESQSELQLRDIESILKIQKELKWGYLKKWAKAHSTLATLEKLRQKV